MGLSGVVHSALDQTRAVIDFCILHARAKRFLNFFASLEGAMVLQQCPGVDFQDLRARAKVSLFLRKLKGVLKVLGTVPFQQKSSQFKAMSITGADDFTLDYSDGLIPDFVGFTCLTFKSFDARLT